MQRCIARAFVMATRRRGPFNNMVNACKTFVSIVIVQLVMNNTTWLLSIWAFESETSGLNGLCVYSGPPPTLAVARLSHTGPSWADRVKCSQSLPVPSPSVNIPAEKPGERIFSIDIHLFSKPDIQVFLCLCIYRYPSILRKERCRGLGDRAAWALHEATLQHHGG